MGEDITPKTQSLWIFQFDAWRRYWLNRRESHSHLHHICEEFRHLQAFWSWLFGCLSLLFLCWCCPRIQLIVSEFFFNFYEKVQHSFALKLKNSFYQCHAGWAKKHSRLRGDGIKNNKQPLHNNKQAIEEVIFVNTDMLSSGWFFYFFANYLLYGCIIIKVGVFIVFLQQYGKCNGTPPLQRLVAATDSDPSKQTLAVGGSTANA